eukprot:4444147-Pyramimonas_sp.AAC.1
MKLLLTDVTDSKVYAEVKEEAAQKAKEEAKEKLSSAASAASTAQPPPEKKAKTGQVSKDVAPFALELKVAMKGKKERNTCWADDLHFMFKEARS